MAGVPDPLDLIAVSDGDGVAWLALVSNPKWEQPLAPEVAALEAPQRAVWMQVHAYLVQVADAEKLHKWAPGKDWFEHWMPQTAEHHNVLLGAHPDDPEWAGADGTVEWWDARAGGPQPVEMWQCAAWYGGTGTSRDASAEEETRGYVPSRRLFELLALSRGVDFTWGDASGIAVCDPSVGVGGPGCLVMRRDLIARLPDAGLTIFWTVLAGNELHKADHLGRDEEYRWVTASASYLLDAGRVVRLDASAARCRPGPTTEFTVDWPTRPREP